MYSKLLKRGTVLVLAVMMVINSLGMNIVFAKTETEKREEGKYFYDFAESADNKATGYYGVDASSIYSETSGYGWRSESVVGVSSVKRSVSKASVKDNGIAYGTSASTFTVDVAEAGEYLISVSAGDRMAGGIETKNMKVSVNGVDGLYDLNIDAGETHEMCFVADVGADKQINITFSGDSWTVAALEIRKYTPYESNNGTKEIISGPDGNFVIETEIALEQSEYAWTKSGAEANWNKVYGVSGYGMQYGPNSTKAYTNYNNSSASAPQMHYAVNFEETGTYIAWALVKASSADDDSVFVLIDNKSNAMPFTNDCKDTGGEYVWVKMKSSINLVVSEAGVHTISVYGREDGLAMDKLILTKDTSFVPSDLGGVMYRAIDETAQENEFTLFADNELADIYIDSENELDSVKRAVRDLVNDINMVTDSTPAVKDKADEVGKNAVIIGTIGKSAVIDSLIAEGKIDVTGVENEWEAFTIALVSDPIDGVESALVIAGSDKRGTIYGIYDLSEQIGVSPWYWWADVPVNKKNEVVLSAESAEKTEKPDVKYRGIFLNDEENFTVWSEKFMNDTDSQGTPNTATYEKVFELMLRLKANTLWPGMHEQSDAFNKYINPETGSSYCAEAADRYGIIMSSSHCEMLLANNPTEWVPWCEANVGKYNLKKINNDWKSSYDYTVNSEAMNAYWEERVAQNYKFENIYMLGLRAVHDAGILHSALGSNPTYEQKAAVVKQAVEAQLAILAKYEAKYAEETGEKIVFAKAFCPYKEAAEYYKYDLGLPEETIILWADDNYGYVRQFPTENELDKYAGSGVYYHVSYWGWPCSYLWMATTPLSLIYEEMHKAYTAGSDSYWILNVGDLKPSEIPMEFFLKLGWNIDCVEEDTIKNYIAETFKRDFSISNKIAEKIADIVTEVYQISNAKKPEYQGLEKGTEYSLIAYGDEGQKVVNRMVELLAESQAIYDGLAENEKDAYYQLVHYMVKSVKLTLEKNIYAQKSKLYASQGRFLSVNAYADAAEAAHESILNELDYYNMTMSDGKWQGILDPYQNVNGLPKIAAEPDVTRVSFSDAEPGVGAVCEGQSTGSEDITLEFHSLSDDKRFLDIFATGVESAEYRIIMPEGICLIDSNGKKLECKAIDGKNVYEGSVDLEERFWLCADWSILDVGTTSFSVKVMGDGDFSVEFAVKCVKSDVDPKKEALSGYYETNGVVSIEAEHYSKSVAVNGEEWKVFSDLGNSGDSMKVYPDTGYLNRCLFGSNTSVTEAIKKAPYVEYNIYFETTGTYSGSFYHIPTLNEGKYADGSSKSCRVLVGLDDGTATLLRCNSGEGSSLWANGVLNNINIYKFSVTVETEGWHTLRIIKSDAGMAFDKIVLTHESKKEFTSVLGAPESYQTVCKAEEETLADLPNLTKDGVVAEDTESVDKRLYDFTADTTKAQSGYIGVSADTTSKKFGWDDDSIGKVAAEYRKDAVKTSDRDKGFVYGTENATFWVKSLDPGVYSVGLASGDRVGNGKTVKNMSVTANGSKVLENIQVSAGSTMEYAFTVEVGEDGLIKLEFSGDLWAVTSLEIWPYEEPRNDVGNGAFTVDYEGYINIEAETALENDECAKIIAVGDSSGTSWYKTNGVSGAGLYFGPGTTLAYTSTSYSQNKAPKAEYQVNIGETGQYNIWILLKTQSQEDDSVFVSVDKATASYVNDIISTDGEYVWKKIATVSITTEGLHTVTVMGREDGISVDKLVMSKKNTAPTGIGGRMIREGSPLDTSELESLIEKSKEQLTESSNSNLEELVKKAEKLLTEAPTQGEVDRMSDTLKEAMGNPVQDEEDYSDLRHAWNDLQSENPSADVSKDSLTTVYENLDLLEKLAELDEPFGKVAQYDFEGDWTNTLNRSDIAIPGNNGIGTAPIITEDEERGNVVRLEAGNVGNASYISVINPFKGEKLENGATVSVWVKSSDIDNYGFIWSAQTKYNFLWMAGAPYFGYDGSGGYIDMNCPHNLPGATDKQGYLKNGKWNLVTTTITNDNVIVYVNGVEILDTADKNYTAGYNTDHVSRVIALLQTSDTIEIGGNNKHWGSASMLADGFTLYNRAITADEALKEYIFGINENCLKSLTVYAENESEKTNEYTQESINEYKIVLSEVKNVLESDSDAEALANAYAKLYEAESLLVKQNNTPEELPGDTESPGDENAPQTGNCVMLLCILCVLAVCVLSVRIKRKA